jgi:glycyl-tRNA synthetase beta chain
MAEFLLELFSEEIPARFQKQAADDLHKLFTDKLTAQGLSFTSAKAHVTPRRVALVVDGLPLEQPARNEEKKGPKVDAPPAAIEGFLKSAGLTSLDACEQRDTPKGKVWFAVANIPGRITAEVLREIISDLLWEFPWKKSQNWGEGNLKWIRPLRNILAIFDGKTLPGHLHYSSIPTKPGEFEQTNDFVFSNETEGHRFMGKGRFEVKNFADYVQKLREAHVILDREERKQIIKSGAEAALKAKGVILKTDEVLLEEVCGLVEWPVALVGKIDDAFMEVPPEVLVTTMRNNQKYFASIDSAGKMSPYFVITANLETADKGAAIIAGNERVLRARFADAKFFWDLDRAKKLADYAKGLSAITFHAKLGTVAEKVARMEKLGVALAIPSADAKDVTLAAQVAKADLVTGMVGEFPELQGIMGGYYARHEKLPPAVAAAIGEHYSPVGPSDACPSAPVSIAVAMADKLDTLVGFFGIDEKPTGSKDPYALRRAALGVLRLIIENKLRLKLAEAIGLAASGYGGKLTVDKLALTSELSAFFADRLKVMLRDKGYRHDLVAAVFGPENMTDIVGQLGKLDALQNALGSEDGKALLGLYRRAANILKIEEKKDGKSYDGTQVFEQNLAEREERNLFGQLGSMSADAHKALAAEKHAEAMQLLVGLRPYLDAFFEKVMVNANDNTLRQTRLHLLARVRNTLHAMGDLSQVEGE